MKILFITSTRIGDVILSTGIINHYIEQHPEAEITIATSPLTAPLFASMPNLVKLIEFEKQPYKKHWWNLWRQFVSQPWDLIADFRGGIISFGLRAGKRYIWSGKGKTGHQVERLSQMMGLTTTPHPHLWLSQAQLVYARTLIPDNQPIIAVAPAANWLGKQWPVEFFIKAFEEFLPRTSSKIAVFAAPHERSSIQPLLDHFSSGQCLDLVGEMGLLEVAACIQRCQLFIGNDSGLMHMAAALRIPTLGLFGPTNNQQYGPWGEGHRVARTSESMKEIKTHPDFTYATLKSYMETLTPQMVVDHLDALWTANLSKIEEI